MLWQWMELYMNHYIALIFTKVYTILHVWKPIDLLLQTKSQSLPVPPGMVKQFRCAFFNFTAEEANWTGGWSYSGVETHVINITHVRCIASHLTSFVVLVSIVPSVGEPVSDKILLHCITCLYQHTCTSCFTLPTFLFHFSLLWITSHTLVAAFHYFVCLPALYST